MIRSVRNDELIADLSLADKILIVLFFLEFTAEGAVMHKTETLLHQLSKRATA